MKVRLLAFVSARGVPAILTVRTFSGKLLVCKKVRCGINEVRFCSCERKLIVSLLPFRADYREISYFLKLPAAPCQTVKLHFNVKESERTATQTFSLYDKSYGFPVISAILSFFKI